jgi:hypothetical protein
MYCMSDSWRQYARRLGEETRRRTVQHSRLTSLTLNKLTVCSSYLDALHLTIDANFKLKRKNRSNHEVLLGDGFAYFGNSEDYAQHLTDHKDPKEVSCI